MPQLANMTKKSDDVRYFRWPYHAKVIKIFEQINNKIVFMNPLIALAHFNKKRYILKLPKFDSK